MMYSFTIIIPHKNIPGLLQRCIDSIPKREDLNIIIVDDNSDPKKVDFENFPGLNDSRCAVVFTKEGRGAGYARNVGLAKTDSKWVLFADADDYYSEELSRFLDKYKDTDYQTVYFYNGTVDNETLEPLEQDKFVQSLLVECEKEKCMDPLRYKAYTPWCKMTQMSVINDNNIRYQEILCANDSYFNVVVGHYAEKYDIYKKEVYIRTVRVGSLAHTSNIPSIMSRLECGYTVNEFLKSVGKIKDYHSETWGHFCDIRKISWVVFIKTFPEYFYRTPWFILKKHIVYSLKSFIWKKD